MLGINTHQTLDFISLGSQDHFYPAKCKPPYNGLANAALRPRNDGYLASMFRIDHPLCYLWEKIQDFTASASKSSRKASFIADCFHPGINRSSRIA